MEYTPKKIDVNGLIELLNRYSPEDKKYGDELAPHTAAIEDFLKCDEDFAETMYFFYGKAKMAMALATGVSSPSLDDALKKARENNENFDKLSEEERAEGFMQSTYNVLKTLRPYYSWKLAVLEELSTDDGITEEFYDGLEKKQPKEVREALAEIKYDQSKIAHLESLADGEKAETKATEKKETPSEPAQNSSIDNLVTGTFIQIPNLKDFIENEDPDGTKYKYIAIEKD